MFDSHDAFTVEGKPAARPFEWINAAGYQARFDAPGAILGSRLPPAASGAPTIADCTALVRALAKHMAHLTLAAASASRVVYKATYPSSQHGAQLYLTSTGAISTSSGTNLGTSETEYTATEAVPVDVVNSNPALQRDLAWRLAHKLGRALDASIVALYSGMVSLPPVGTAGTNLSTANLDTLVANLGGTGQPIFLLIHPGQLMALAATVSSGNVVVPELWQGGGWRYNGMRLVPCDQILRMGSSPVTTNNIALVPSAIALVSEQQAETNDATNAQCLSTWTPIMDGAQPQLSVLVKINNTGSGNQTVTASVKSRVVIANSALCEMAKS